MLDLYFEEKYGLLYEGIEKGACAVFEHRSDFGVVRHLFIKRPVPVRTGEDEYYELVTPYGYGGPVITQCTGGKKELVRAFEAAFRVYCKEQRIVSEFVRFHPVLGNAADFSVCYALTLRRKTTGTNLKDFGDPVKEEFSKSKQKSIRKALEAGVVCRVTANPDSLDAFQEMYHETMKRKAADDVYFFDAAYFRNLLHYLGKYVLLVEVEYEGNVIGMGLNFFYGKLIHIHLSGTDAQHHALAPSAMLRYALVEWGKTRGMELIHEGGGTSGSPDDPLYVFKKQFGKHTDFDYFVSHKVWDEEMHELLYPAAQAASASLVAPVQR
ncbi:GNAT family N-acetyltransferase [Planomicrobium sp. YIM 101495]|uniref:GNAT family N-acetyltransferase n=1 Tax=Planomicrobium sp. YIM 101495 TaxID=2665160 RepID=UPI0012B897A8|nr:GNAT family N-acetyltransferase [Planomicrobium sp. YIM 101495]MTD30755.1 GNAT family N-acetyltransferase [Planomicrobium sp. YIM 101495]